MEYLWAVLLCISLIVGWGLAVFSLPGNWVMVAAAAGYAFLVPADARFGFSWWWVVGLVVMALVGEGVELLAGAMGASKTGGSKRSTIMAIVGSFVGSFGLAWVGIPIPVVGPIVAAIVGACLGALGGAVLGEQWKGRDLNHSLKVGSGAFLGRLIGTIGKLLIATAMVTVTLLAAVL